MRRARLVVAWLGGLVSAGLMVAYYAPGMAEDTDLVGLVWLLGAPAAGLAMPFVLLGALLRVPIVWIACAGLMICVVGWTGIDMLVQDGSGGVSLLIYFAAFGTNLAIVLVGAAIDVAIRSVRSGARSARAAPDFEQ